MAYTAGPSLVQWLKSNVPEVSGRVHQNRVPANPTFPYVWLAKDGAETFGANDDDDWVPRQRFDIEVVSLDVDETFDLANTIRTRLAQLPPGAFGNGFVGGVSIESQRDGYEPRNLQGDEFANIGALEIIVHNYSENP